MTTYTVTVQLEVEADTKRQAAERAYSLMNDMTPTTVIIDDEVIELTEEEAKEVLRASFDGTLFPSK